MKQKIRDLILGRYPEFLENLRLPDDLTTQGLCRTSPEVKENRDLFCSDNIGDIAKAKSICAQCPLAQTCLDYAVYAEEYHVWGGTTPAERKKLRGSRPIYTLQERAYAVRFRNDTLRMSAPHWAQKYKQSERQYYRWRELLLGEKNAS